MGLIKMTNIREGEECRGGAVVLGWGRILAYSREKRKTGGVATPGCT